ncbi:MAG TPA: nuclear transport factor 2 family protein [Sphingomicrobium sp.]|nr:nuclear transport factor 2 family protein [Sphingomicrobium sp.]
MADIAPVIETLENRWMRAWVQRDLKTLKALTARDFILLVGSKPPAILDQRSWLDAAKERYRCTSFRFGDIHVRRIGALALFATRLELEARMDDRDWSGSMWMTDLWRKKRIGGWRMVERVISRPDDAPEIPAAIRSLQLWK